MELSSRFCIFFLIFSFSRLLFSTEPVNLERLEYENARDIVLRTIQMYPAEKYNYVGVGRSVTPIVTILHELYPKSVFILPLSNMYFRPQIHPGYQSPLSDDAEKRLYNHFQKFLPSVEDNQGKEVLFLDFVMGGGSAVSTEEYLSKFADEKRPDIKVKMLIFSPLLNPDKILEANKDYDVISTRSYDVINSRWMFSWFDSRAEYGNFSFPFEGSDSLKPNSGKEREKFLEHYRNFIKYDKKLASFFLSCGTKLIRLISRNPS